MSEANERSELVLDTSGHEINKIFIQGFIEILRFKSIDNEKSNSYNI